MTTTAVPTVPPTVAASEIAGHAGAAKASTSCRKAATAVTTAETAATVAAGREPAASTSVDLGGISRWNEGC
jgi:hypothetical protein